MLRPCVRVPRWGVGYAVVCSWGAGGIVGCGVVGVGGGGGGCAGEAFCIRGAVVVRRRCGGDDFNMVMSSCGSVVV